MRTLSKLMLAAALAVTASACVDDDGSANFTISNDSSYFIDEVHLASVDDPTWGPDLIAGSLAPGDELIITGVSCNTYDVLVVDETGVECQLSNIDICIDDDGWVIDDTTLDVCAFNPARSEQPNQ